MASLRYAVEIDTRRAQSQLRGLENSITGVGKVIAGAFAANEVISFADGLIGVRNRIAAFTNSQAEAAAMFDEITRVAANSRSGLEETAQLYSRLNIAAADLGLSTQQVGDITQTFAQALKVGGASAKEAQSAMLQFSQAMGSGVLRGEEFNAVFEAAPTIIRDIAKELGVPVGQMRKLAEEGKLTANVVSQALLKMQGDVQERFNKTIPTIGEFFTAIRTAAGVAFSELASEGDTPVGKLAELSQNVLKLANDIPALTSAIKELANVFVILALSVGVTKVIGTIVPMLMNFALAAGNTTSKMGAMAATGGMLANGINALKNSATGLALAFNITTIKNLIANLTQLSVTTGNARTLFGGLLAIMGRMGAVVTLVAAGFLRFVPVVGWIMAVVEGINLLYRVITKTDDTLIDLSGAISKVIEVFRVLGGLQVAVYKKIAEFVSIVWDAIGGLNGFWQGARRLNPILNLLGMGIDFVAANYNEMLAAFMNNEVIVAAGKALDWIGQKLAGLWQTAREISGVAAADAKAAGKKQKEMDKTFRFMSVKDSLAPPKPKPNAGGGIPMPAGGGGGGGGGGGSITAGRTQAEINKEILESLNEINRTFNKGVNDRLAALKLDNELLGMSQDYADIRRQIVDIERQGQDTIDELNDKEKEILENQELTLESRQKNLALIQQQRQAVVDGIAKEIAQTTQLIGIRQKFNIEFEKQTMAMRRQQEAFSAMREVLDLTDELTLLGLYGDALENQQLVIEQTRRQRELETEYQRALLDLENRRAEIGEERYINEKNNLDIMLKQNTAQNQLLGIIRQQNLERKREDERNNIGAAIGKRLEEMERAVDPAVLAVQKLDSAFNNIGNALDEFVDTGKLRFGDLARSIIADIAKIELRAALSGIFKAIFGKGGIFGAIFGGSSPDGRATGGPVTQKPYIVGENGPELFVPNSMGSILSNATLNRNANSPGSNGGQIVNNYITNNITAMDSKSVAQVFMENRKALLGASISAQRELPYGGS